MHVAIERETGLHSGPVCVTHSVEGWDCSFKCSCHLKIVTHAQLFLSKLYTPRKSRRSLSIQEGSPRSQNGQIMQEYKMALFSLRNLMKFFHFSSSFFLSFFRATPMAYGSSQSRGPIRAIAAGLYHSHSNLSHVYHLHHSSQQHRILNPLSKARDRTGILMDTSWVC